MRKLSFVLIASALLFTACHTERVKVRGKVEGLQGTVKLLAEMPGEQGLVVLAQQEVTDGNVDLFSDVLTIPARVWADIAGKRTLEFIVDTKDQIWIKGKAKFMDQVEVKGSGIEREYDDIRKLFKEKYEGPIEPIDRSIQRIMNKEKQSKDDEVMLGVYQLQKQKYQRYRANYTKTLIEANPSRELSLFLLVDELKENPELQKTLFNSLKIENKESNIYKVLAEKFK